MRFFIYVIMTSQLMGALLVFSSLDARLKQTPLANVSAIEGVFLAIIFLTFLLGVLGAILILAGKRAGFWLSIAHQIMLVPLIYFPNGFRWILEDAASFAIFVSKAANGFGFVATFAFGDATILAVLKPQPDTIYIGINIFAVVFAIYIYVASRREMIIGGMPGEGVPAARLVIYVIAFLQILAALISFAKIYQQYQATPSDPALRSWLLVGAGIYLLGFAGAIFLFVRSQLGILLSILFHLLCTPVLFLAAQKFVYASVEIVNLVVYYANEGEQHHFGLLVDIGADLYYEFPKFTQTPTIVALNVFALICALYLFAARSQLRSRAPTMTIAG